MRFECHNLQSFDCIKQERVRDLDFKFPFGFKVLVGRPTQLDLTGYVLLRRGNQGAKSEILERPVETVIVLILP